MKHDRKEFLSVAAQVLAVQTKDWNLETVAIANDLRPLMRGICICTAALLDEIDRIYSEEVNDETGRIRKRAA